MLTIIGEMQYFFFGSDAGYFSIGKISGFFQKEPKVLKNSSIGHRVLQSSDVPPGLGRVQTQTNWHLHVAVCQAN